jgi:copper chaperone CopZ
LSEIRYTVPGMSCDHSVTAISGQVRATIGKAGYEVA